MAVWSTCLHAKDYQERDPSSGASPECRSSLQQPMAGHTASDVMHGDTLFMSHLEAVSSLPQDLGFRS